MLYLTGIVITFFLSIILAGKKGRTQSDIILMLWLAFTCLHFSLYYIFISNAFVHFPYLLGLELPLPLTYGPFLFLYATSLTQTRKINFKSLFHFVPALVLYLYLIPFYISSSQQKIYVYQNQGIGYETLLAVNRIAIIASGITYIVVTLLMLRRHRKNIAEEFSNTDKINLNWLRYLTYGTSAIWIVIIAGFQDRWIYTTATFYVFFLGYFGIRQVGIFSNQDLKEMNEEISSLKNSDDPISMEHETVESKPHEIISTEEKAPTDSTTKTKYQKSSLTDKEGKRIHEQLTLLMVREELFKNPELNLAEVAKRLDVHPNILSQVINSFERKSFYDYINGQRVEEFKKLANHPDHKQFTGLSPSEYLNEQNVVLAD